MKNNMIRATRASMDSTILYWPTGNFIELLFLNQWTWTLGILGSFPEDGDGAPTAYHSSKLSNLSPSKSTPRNGEATLAQGKADEMLGMVGGAIPSQGHHLRDEWTSWTSTMVTMDYNGMLFYSYSIVVQYSPVVLCVVLFFEMFAPCDVLQNYQNVCLATCEGSRKFINNARPTSWDSPPRPAVSSKSAEKFEQIPVKSQFDHVLISIPFHFYIWILKGHETRWSFCKLPVAPCTLLSSSPSPSSPSANRVTGEDLAGPNTNRTKLKSWTMQHHNFYSTISFYM